MTPVIDLSSSNFERIVKDRARSMMVMYYNGNCDLCNSLQNTIHDVGITFRNEPKCLIGRLNCDTEPQICIEQTIPHYPTFKVYSLHNKDGVVYEPGPHQESYSERNMTTFMNALCGTQREMRGRLNEKVNFDILQIALQWHLCSAVVICMNYFLWVEVSMIQHLLKQWIALKIRSDWLVKLRTSFAIYLWTTRLKMAPLFASAVTSEEIIQINFLWCILSCGVYTKTTIHLTVGG